MNKKIRCLIVDDEPIAREGMARYVKRVDSFELAGECEDAMQLDSVLKSGTDSGETVDLIFLDIEMPHISGLEYLSAIENAPMVILTTAYSQYAVRSYELNVLDYLLKPVSFPRFLKAASKAIEYFNLQAAGRHREYMFVRADKKLHKVSFADILYIEAIENYVKIVTSDRAIMTRMTLFSILEQLPGDDFIQIHKSYIVNMAHVSCIEGNMLTLPGAVIQMSRSYRATLAAWLEKR